MASEQAHATFALFRQLREQTLDASPSLEQLRAAGEQFGAMTAEPEGVSYQPVDVDGIPGQWIQPDGSSPDHVLLYLHGGGYKACSVQSHRKLVGHIATAACCRGLAIDYRLTPEHPHPAQVEDACRAYEWLLANGIDSTGIALAGDSAGGGLVMLTLLALKTRGLPLPAAGAVLSPWIDLESSGDSMISRADRDLLITAQSGKEAAADFLQGRDPRDPTAAPLHADLGALPPIAIQVGDHEVLLDDSTRLAERIRQAGGEVTIEIFPEMQHVFQVCAGNMPEADRAISRLGAWLAGHLGSNS
jgi:acetyl esterase/lipase